MLRTDELLQLGDAIRAERERGREGSTFRSRFTIFLDKKYAKVADASEAALMPLAGVPSVGDKVEGETSRSVPDGSKGGSVRDNANGMTAGGKSGKKKGRKGGRK